MIRDTLEAAAELVSIGLFVAMIAAWAFGLGLSA